MMEVLTKEIYKEKVNDAIRNCYLVVDIRNYIVVSSSIDYDYDNFDPAMWICFTNCIIESMYPIRHEIWFVDCNIIDYKRIKSIGCVVIREGCAFIKPVPLACPAEGEFVGYKVCKYNDSSGKTSRCIVKLLIPEYAKRSSAFTNKCRCSEAYVLELLDLNGNPLPYNEEAESMFADDEEEKKIVYRKGCEVRADRFDENRYNECSGGIHFFMTFKEAKNYGEF